MPVRARRTGTPNIDTLAPSCARPAGGHPRSRNQLRTTGHLAQKWHATASNAHEDHQLAPRERADLHWKVSAPSATQTRDLLLRRHSSNVAALAHLTDIPGGPRFVYVGANKSGARPVTERSPQPTRGRARCLADHGVGSPPRECARGPPIVLTLTSRASYAGSWSARTPGRSTYVPGLNSSVRSKALARVRDTHIHQG
jgi:hypothetical protein